MFLHGCFYNVCADKAAAAEMLVTSSVLITQQLMQTVISETG